MKTIPFFCLALSIALFVACDDSGDELKVKKEVFGGYAQKGPFVNGSSVTISELDANLDQTGRVYLTTISDNSGRFEKKNIELVSNYVELKADGFYFDEISGQTSIAQMTLYALADVKNANSANVNVLTHLEKPRVEYLVKQEEMNFAAAKQQAQREILAIFGFEPLETSSESLNLTDNAALLAVSCILQGYLSTGDMMELMANICADIKTDGVLSPDLGTELINYAYVVSLSIGQIRNNLIAKYATLSENITIPDFESYVQSFIESKLYPRTFVITFPATGLYGDNILSDAVTSVKRGLDYSMRVDLPFDSKNNTYLLAQSLKIVAVFERTIRFPDSPGSDLDIEAYFLSPPIGSFWYYSYDYDNLPEDKVRLEFTPYAIADMRIQLFDKEDYVTIEYYENYSITPTKVKTLYIEE